MTACADWREQLVDHALGLPVSPGLEAHLAGCAACASALAAWRAQVEQLDTGVRQLVASEPSPYLRSRVLAELNSQSARFVWVERWRRALAALAVVAGLAVLGYAVRGALERQKQVETVSAALALSQWRSPTEALLQSPADALLKTVPRLGESFFTIKPEAGESKPAKGGKDAS